MALTLGTTGMDSATETALHAAFKSANLRTGGRWQLQGENDADFVVVDMDNVYGPMSWLRLHAAGKAVIGLTTASRTQTDYRLARPFDAGQIAELLDAIAQQSGAAAPTAQAAAWSEPAPVAKPAAAVATPAPTAPEPAVTTRPARQPGFADWLDEGVLAGKVRYAPAGGQPVLIDADNRQYFGPAALKPLAGHFVGTIVAGDFANVDAVQWARESAAFGTAQPLLRLQWYGGLLAGRGVLLPGYDPAGKFRLGKWPQTEREFPKHFRIATAMMKGPATLEEIVAGSGISAEEVADFVNANLVTGYAEPVVELPPEPVDAQKGGSLFGRLRGK
jgi:hypothetical protein